MYAIVKDQSHLIGKVIGLLKIDSDWLLFQTLFALVLLWMVWPLAFLGYLATVYGPHILIGR
jgi:hypothetical protein